MVVVRKWIGLFVACGVLVCEPVSAVVNRACAAQFKQEGKRVLWGGKDNFLFLPDAGKRFLIGSLVKTEDDKYLLGIGDYRMKHEYLELALDTMRDLDSISNYHYLWLGELKGVRKEKGEGWVSITQANETSSLWVNRNRQHRADQNSIGSLAQILSDFWPTLPSAAPEYLSFEDCEQAGRIYLLNPHNRFVTRFNEMKREGCIAPNETYRHYLGDKVFVVSAQFEHILEKEELYPDEKSKMAAWREALEKPMAFDSIYLYFRLAENSTREDSLAVEIREMLKRYSKKGKRKGEFGYRDWHHLATLMAQYRFDKKQSSSVLAARSLWVELNPD